MDPKSEKDKNNLIIIAGVLLILAVCLFTLFRNGSKNNKSTSSVQPIVKIDSSNLISTSDLQKKIRSGEKLSIVDIRDQNDFLIEHIQDSANVPFSNLANSNFQDSGNAFVIVDYADSDQSSQALQILKNKKIKNIFVLSGGITTWKQNRGSVISYGDPNSFTDAAKVTYITSEDLKSAIGSNYPPFIIDVRNAQSFSAGRIPKATNIFLDNLEKTTDKIPLDKPVVVYGSVSLDGFQSGVRLYDLGFLSAKVLQNGFSDWQTKGFAVEK